MEDKAEHSKSMPPSIEERDQNSLLKGNVSDVLSIVAICVSLASMIVAIFISSRSDSSARETANLQIRIEACRKFENEFSKFYDRNGVVPLPICNSGVGTLPPTDCEAERWDFTPGITNREGYAQTDEDGVLLEGTEAQWEWYGAQYDTLFVQYENFKYWSLSYPQKDTLAEIMLFADPRMLATADHSSELSRMIPQAKTDIESFCVELRKRAGL